MSGSKKGKGRSFSKWCCKFQRCTEKKRPVPLFSLALILLAAAASLPSGCSRQAEKPAESSPADDDGNAYWEDERGPVKVRVEVDPPKASLSDEPTLTLTIDYQRGVTVDKPPFGKSFGDFEIRDFHEPMLKIAGDREIIRQIYTLEPMRTGKLPIYPISVTFTDDRPDGDGQEHTIESEGLTVEITSVVGSELPSLEELRPMAPPVELPQPRGFRVRRPITLLLLVVAVLVGLWRWLRRRKAVDATLLSPQELAYLELEKLLEAGLAETDVKQYYVELTAVVRRYIERTTGIRAPEQTTEEFLHQISRRQTFPPAESARLKSFLESADLVKFAARRPRKEDIEESFQRAKIFIALEQTEVAA